MIKKISKGILFTLICILFAPTVVKADMGAPEMQSYKIVVKETEGAPLYDYNKKEIGTVPVDQVLEVTLEEYIGDTLYGYVTYNNKYGYIKISDTKLYKDKLSPEENEYAEKISGKKYVFAPGAKLYKGPSFAYDEVTGEDIKVGTTLDYTYKDEMWIYTKYDGKEGWVYQYTYSGFGPNDKTSSLADIKSGKVLTINDVKIYKDVQKETETGTTIPKGKEIKYKYTYFPFAKVSAFYVEYEETQGWVFKESMMGASDKDILISYSSSIYPFENKKITVYEDYDCSKKLTTIDGNKEIKTKYSYSLVDEDSYDYSDIFYVEYDNGKYGWINSDETEIAIRYNYIFKTTDTTNLYTNPIDGKKKEVSIPKEKEIKILYIAYTDDATWLYIDTDEYNGWIKENEKTVKMVDRYDLPEDEEEEPEEAIDPAEEKEKKKKKDDDNDTEEEGLTTVQILIMAIIGAAVLAITIVVVIFLINKKKQNKK